MKSSINFIYLIILCICLISCTEDKSEILTSITQDAANNVIVLLGNNGIDANKQIEKDGTYNIEVAYSQKLVALEILKENGLPKHEFDTFGKVFKKDSFISSPNEEHSRFIYALNQEISGLLSSMDGIVEVKTIVNVPAIGDNLTQNQIPASSASVIIKYKSGERIDLYINKIRVLVANAVPGLTQDKVEVLTFAQKDNK